MPSPASPPAARPPHLRRIGSVNWLGFWTLVRRDLQRYRKEALETIVAPAFQALIYFAVFLFALGPQRGMAAGDALLSFVVPGLVILAVLTRAAETTSFLLLYDRMEGMISDILMAPISPGELTAAYALSGTIAGVVTGLVVLVGALLIRPVLPVEPWAIPVFAAGGALMLALWGVLVGLWADKWDQLAAAFVFVMVPLTFLSGVFTPVETLPGPFDRLIALNPVFFAVDGFRYGFLGQSYWPPGLSITVLAVMSAGQWLLCGWLIRRGWKLRA
jgi:ABC-2 type transport system permease protein